MLSVKSGAGLRIASIKIDVFKIAVKIICLSSAMKISQITIRWITVLPKICSVESLFLPKIHSVELTIRQIKLT